MAEQRTISGSEHTDLMRLRDRIEVALVAEMTFRPDHEDWEQRERQAVAAAANEWSSERGAGRRVWVEDVERIEVMAVGHVDYVSKLSLYVAEYVLGGTRG